MPSLDIVLRFVAAALAGYLLGAIPSGVIVSRLFGAGDPRAAGSGKTGTTNILRTAGPGAAACVLLLDVGKGVAAVLLARYLWFGGSGANFDTLRSIAEAIAGFAALLGHNYSVFIGFKGGRGVATGAGTMIAILPLAFVFGVIAFVGAIAITRYVSLGSILGAAFSAIAAVVLAATGHAPVAAAVYLVVGATFIIVSHADNIRRLLSGTERKLGQKA